MRYLFRLCLNVMRSNIDHLSSNQGAGKAVQVIKGVVMQCVCLCVYCKKKSQVSKVRRAGLDAETVAQRGASLLGIIAGSHPSGGGLALVPPPRLRDTDQMCHHQYLEDPGAAEEFHNQSKLNRIESKQNKTKQNRTEYSNEACIGIP